MKSYIENDKVKVTTRSMGGELISFVDKSTGTEHIWQGSESSWTGQSPTLFPIVGRLNGGEFSYKGQKYQLPLHGFARKLEHTIVASGEDFIKYRLEENEETLKGYPFRFRLETTYSLSGSQLEYGLVVTNPSLEDSYCSLGFHTGLRSPFAGDELANYSLHFEKQETVTRLGCEGLLTDKTEDYLTKPIALAPAELADSIVLANVTSDYVALVNKVTGISIKLYTGGAPYLVIWATGDPKEFVCIEPWHGLPDYKNVTIDIREKAGIHRVEQGKSFSVKQKIELTKYN